MKFRKVNIDCKYNETTKKISLYTNIKKINSNNIFFSEIDNYIEISNNDVPIGILKNGESTHSKEIYNMLIESFKEYIEIYNFMKDHFYKKYDDKYSMIIDYEDDYKYINYYKDGYIYSNIYRIRNEYDIEHTMEDIKNKIVK